MDEVTVFTLFKAVTDKLGITQAWLTATATNVMTLTVIAKAKFDVLKGFWATTILVAVATGMLAAAEFFAAPLNIVVAVILVWAGTTLLMKGGEKSVDVAAKGFGRGPSQNTDVKPG
jgi:hypothetical protein